MKKIAADRNYRMLKRAEDKPAVIFVSGMNMFGQYRIDTRGTSATGEILWSKGFQGKEEALKEAVEYIKKLKVKYPNVKIDAKGVQAPLTAKMLGL